MAAESPSMFIDAAVLLAGAVVAAPLFKKIGLGTVLGYIAVGIILGPAIGYMRGGEDVLHVAEIGVVLLLFLVGLELKPARLWDMRTEIFGLGASQVLASGVVLAVAAWLIYFEWRAAIAVGFGLALSSTAFALQLLEEKGDESTKYGNRAFSILLFQDIVIAPLLVLVAILSAGSIDFNFETFQSVAVAIGCLVALLLLGRYALDPLFGIIANTGAREAMIAAALLIVLGSALLMDFAGLSMAMGAFIAGVMLAESSYRHELEADIEPFRGILLGLFFIAVGLSVDLSIIVENWMVIALLVPALMALKAGILFALCRVFGSSHNEALRIAFLLPQHGEFGFVMFSSATAAALITLEESSFLIACITLSMILTPLSVSLGQWLTRADDKEEMEEDFDGAGSEVLMVGFSRLGQIVSQVLLAGGRNVTIIDNDANRIRSAAAFGFRIYFGDGTRRDVLRSAGAEKARIIAVTTRDPETTDTIVSLLRSEFPDAKIFVRSYDREHALKLIAEGVDYQIRETFESAITMGGALLRGLGCKSKEAAAIIDDVRLRDLERLKMQAEEGSIEAGKENLHTKPVPEPLFEPKHKAHAIGDEARQALAERGNASN